MRRPTACQRESKAPQEDCSLEDDEWRMHASQALKLGEALLRGEPNRMKIALTSAHDTVRELI